MLTIISITNTSELREYFLKKRRGSKTMLVWVYKNGKPLTRIEAKENLGEIDGESIVGLQKWNFNYIATYIPKYLDFIPYGEVISKEQAVELIVKSGKKYLLKRSFKELRSLYDEMFSRAIEQFNIYFAKLEEV
jgi:hypothetical protein